MKQETKMNATRQDGELSAMEIGELVVGSVVYTLRFWFWSYYQEKKCPALVYQSGLSDAR